MDEINRDQHIVKIKYMVEQMDGTPVCTPFSLEPPHLTMNEYHVSINEETLQVSDITNRSYGPILYEGSEMSFEQLTATT